MNARKVNHPLNVYLAVDGSEHSLAAIRLLGELPLAAAQRPGSSVTALAVLDLRHTASRATLLAVLDKTQSLLAEKGIQAKTGLLHGNPAEEIARFADEHPPDLIVLGAKGLRATLGILLGGVAQQAVEYVRCPVLIVRAPYQGLRRVLLISDGSQHSQRAAENLMSFRLPAGAAIRVTHVLPPVYQPEAVARSWPVYPEVLPIIPEKEIEEAMTWRAAQEQQGREIVSETVNGLKAAVLDATGVLLQGDAATELLDYIKKEAIDLFVAGSRGLSQVQSWLLGSVSRKLIHYAPCSGLIVKQPRRPSPT
jgi:nucleotide-binding universal stress UspA family protein